MFVGYITVCPKALFSLEFLRKLCYSIMINLPLSMGQMFILLCQLSGTRCPFLSQNLDLHKYSHC